jgi:stress-induced morphogen
MFDCKVLQKKIEDSLSGADVVVWDTRNDGNHLQAKVTWDGFDGKTLIEQHKIVYAALKEEMEAGLHSISIKTKIRE